MFLASMARFSLLVCLLAFYLVSCKLSISSAFRQLNALLRFFHISFFGYVMKHWQIQRSRLAKQVDISQADRPPRRAPFWWSWIPSSPLHNSLCPHLLLLYCCLSLVSFLFNIKGMDLTSNIFRYLFLSTASVEFDNASSLKHHL